MGLKLGIHTGRRLVHEQYRWLGAERSGNQDTLSLAAGEFADQAVTVSPHSCLFQRRPGEFPVLGGVSASPPRVAESTHKRNIQNGNRKILVESGILRNVPKHSGGFRGGLAEDLHAALPRFQNPQDDLEQGGFAAAVRTDYRQEIPLGHRHAHIRQDGMVVVEKGNSVQLDCRKRHVRNPIASQEQPQSARRPAGGSYPSQGPDRRLRPTCPQPHRPRSARTWANIAAERIWPLLQAPAQVL